MMWSPPHIARTARARRLHAVLSDDDIRDRSRGRRSREPDRPKQAAILGDGRYSWRPIRRRDFKAVMEDARVVLNEGFDRNPMFVPVSVEEYAFQAGEMMWVMDPRLSVVVYHDGKPAGVIVCIPDLNPFMRACRSRLSLTAPWHFLKQRLFGDRAVIIYYSVTPDLQGRGTQRRHAEPAQSRRRNPPATGASARPGSATSIRRVCGRCSGSAQSRCTGCTCSARRWEAGRDRPGPAQGGARRRRGWRRACTTCSRPDGACWVTGCCCSAIRLARFPWRIGGRDWRLSHGAHFEGSPSRLRRAARRSPDRKCSPGNRCRTVWFRSQHARCARRRSNRPASR
jgi:hypothetical protein